MRRAALGVIFAISVSGADLGESAGGLEPLVGLPPHPVDNPPTAEKVALGRSLFFDNILSGERRRSCSTCHRPELYFTDGFSRAWGLNESELRRKTPNLLNVGWQRSMFFDGRVDTLEEQVRKPLENPLEMNLDPAEGTARVAASARYRAAFERVFPGEPITFDLIAKAIASYERTLISNDSDFDRYLTGDADALSAAAKRGLDLFTGRAGCVRCHNGPLLTDHQKHYTGVPENPGDNPPGAKYKTQSLRDVMRRFSYMHHGEMLKIGDVLDHYARGGSAPEGVKAEIEPIEFDEGDRKDLIAFLTSLNGRVTALLDESPPGTDVFNVSKVPATADEEEAASQTGPALDPSYAPKRR